MVLAPKVPVHNSWSSSVCWLFSLLYLFSKAQDAYTLKDESKMREKYGGTATYTCKIEPGENGGFDATCKLVA